MKSIAIKKILIFGIPSLIILILLFFSFTLFMFGGGFYSEFNTYKSQDNSKVIIIEATEAKDFFGPQNIMISARNDNFLNILEEKYHTKIYNDGKSLNDGNIDVVWKDDKHAEINLTG